MDDTTERWLPVIGFEGLYEVSNRGRVQSLDRIAMSRNRSGPVVKHLRGKILAQTIDGYGYLAVSLRRDGKARPYRVHGLVGEAFLGPRPPGMDTRHGPAGRLVNSVVNLCYGTRIENEQDKIRDGTFRHNDGTITRGEANWNTPLTTALVIEIRRLYAVGHRQVALGEAFGVSQAAISKIVRRETWSHVT